MLNFAHLVPQIVDIKDAHQMSEVEHIQVLRESRALCDTLMTGFKGEKMNVAALGNMVPQLHIHHIVRSKDDAAWPAPIWGYQALTPLSTNQLKMRIEVLKQNVPDGLTFIV